MDKWTKLANQFKKRREQDPEWNAQATPVLRSEIATVMEEKLDDLLDADIEDQLHYLHMEGGLAFEDLLAMFDLGVGDFAGL